MSAACANARDPRYTEPVEWLAPAATSHALLYVEPKRKQVFAFEPPGLAASQLSLPAVVHAVAPRAKHGDTLLVLNGETQPNAVAVFAIRHHPSKPASTSGNDCTDAATPPADATLVTSPPSDSGCQVADGSESDSAASDAALEDADAGPVAEGASLLLQPYEARGTWQDWWQSPDGQYLLLTGLQGQPAESALARPVALIALSNPKQPVERYDSQSGVTVLEDVAFSEPVADDGTRLIALRQSTRVNVLEQRDGVVLREFLIDRMPSAAQSTTFAPSDVLFVANHLIVREHDSNTLLSWRWSRDAVQASERGYREVTSLRFEAPLAAMLGSAHADKSELLVALAVGENAAAESPSSTTLLVRIDLDRPEERKELELDMPVTQLFETTVLEGAGLCPKLAVIATDMANENAKLTRVVLDETFARQTVQILDLPQGLHALSFDEADPQAGVLLIYAQQGAGRLAADGPSIRSFGRGLDLKQAVRDPHGRLWTRQPGRRAVDYVDTRVGGAVVTLPVDGEPTTLLPIFPDPQRTGSIVALYPSVVGAAAIIESSPCRAPAIPAERRFFLATALTGQRQ